ncbi:hypothetical protein KA012_04180 [Candidatus Woesebacteria bacterium]|nr:hypothetical protein [Candidatus Woesebacteria bacterium]
MTAITVESAPNGLSNQPVRGSASFELDMLMTDVDTHGNPIGRADWISKVVTHSDGPALFLLLERLSDAEVAALEALFKIDDLHSKANGNLLINLTKATNFEPEGLPRTAHDSTPNAFFQSFASDATIVSDLITSLRLPGIRDSFNPILNQTALFAPKFLDFIAEQIATGDAYGAAGLLRKFLGYIVKHEHATTPTGAIYHIVSAISWNEISPILAENVHLNVPGISRVLNAEFVRLLYASPVKALQLATWLESPVINAIFFGDRAQNETKIWENRAALAEVLLDRCVLAACSKILAHSHPSATDQPNYTDWITILKEYLRLIKLQYIMISGEESDSVGNIELCLSIAELVESGGSGQIESLRNQISEPFVTSLVEVQYSSRNL